MSAKTLFVAALLATCVLANGERDYEAMFREFKSTHLKAYANEAEESQRFKNFVANMKQAEVMQARNPLAEFGMNVFADVSEAEFKATHLDESFFKREEAKEVKRVEAPLKDRLAAAGQVIDWRQKGAVTAVKNQGQCGGCWAFSVTAEIEGKWFLAGNPLANISMQELISCDKGNSGCGGGLRDPAYDWVMSRKGQVITEEAYPYVSGDGHQPACRTSELDILPVGATIIGYDHLAQSEDTLASYVFQTGPVSVGVDASSFQTYRSGILTNCVSRSRNHAVLAVGFDDTNVPPYWIVKNSWGTSWGEQGYIRVAKGSNQCLINSYCVASKV